MNKQKAKILFDFLSQHPGELEVQLYCGEDSDYEETSDVLVLDNQGNVVLSVGKDGNTDARVLVGQCEVGG